MVRGIVGRGLLADGTAVRVGEHPVKGLLVREQWPERVDDDAWHGHDALLAALRGAIDRLAVDLHGVVPDTQHALP